MCFHSWAEGSCKSHACLCLTNVFSGFSLRGWLHLWQCCSRRGRGDRSRRRGVCVLAHCSQEKTVRASRQLHMYINMSLQLLQLSSTPLWAFKRSQTRHFRVIELPLFLVFRSSYGENCCIYQNLDLQCEYYIGVSGRGSGLGVRDFQEHKGLNSKNRDST